MLISYLTWLHEKTGVHSEHIEISPHIFTINDLIESLSAKEQKYKDLFKNKHIIYAALNGETVPHNTHIKNQDSLSFYSAIAGG